jgi:hypothetical protein
MGIVGSVLLLAAFCLGGALILFGVRPKAPMRSLARILVGSAGAAVCILSALPVIDFVVGLAQVR